MSTTSCYSLPAPFLSLLAPANPSAHRMLTKPACSTSPEKLVIVLVIGALRQVIIFMVQQHRGMGRLYLTKLDGMVYSCRCCHTHLANLDELMAKTFHCKHGKAYLFNSVVNVLVGQHEQRMMTTGLHVVADIYCLSCNQNVGWKYEAAYEDKQKYKEGKYILERGRIEDNWKESSHVSSDTDDM